MNTTLALWIFSEAPDLLTWSRQGVSLDHDSWERRLTILQTPSDLCAHLISHRWGMQVPPQVHVSACPAGTDAIGAAFHEIRSGRRQIMLAGGTDSMINPLGVGGFCKLRALSTRNDSPTQASRPFDRSRDGFVLGEGAGLLVLENRDVAIARRARIHAEIVGYGNSFDAHGISEPHPEGRGALQAMSRAIRDAGIGPEQIDCINAHGSSTPKNDAMETIAIKQLLGDRAASVPVVSTKSMIGHLIAAAGGVEVIAPKLCLENRKVHPTINLTDPDPSRIAARAEAPPLPALRAERGSTVIPHALPRPLRTDRLARSPMPCAWNERLGDCGRLRLRLTRERSLGYPSRNGSVAPRCKFEAGASKPPTSTLAMMERQHPKAVWPRFPGDVAAEARRAQTGGRRVRHGRRVREEPRYPLPRDGGRQERSGIESSAMRIIVGEGVMKAVHHLAAATVVLAVCAPASAQQEQVKGGRFLPHDDRPRRRPACG